MSIAITRLQSGYDQFQLKDVTLTIEEGSFTSLIGPNGCGKSTLLKTIARQMSARVGTIEIAGKDVSSLKTVEVARLVSILPQHPIVPAGISVEQLVGYGRAPHQNFLGLRSKEDKRHIEKALDITSLQALRHVQVTELSGGQRQRAFLAMCIAQDTPYILLDEPISFLDVKFQHEVLDLLSHLNDQKRTVITVLHDIALAARYATNIVMMDAGRLVAAGLAAEVINEARVEAVYGLPVHVYSDPITGTAVVTRK